MTLVIDAPEIEAQLQEKAARAGQDVTDYVLEVLAREATQGAGALTGARDRAAAMRAGAEALAPLYAASLAEGGELTAFTTDMPDDLHEYTAEELQSIAEAAQRRQAER